MENYMKKNIYEKYTILTTFLFVVLFGAFASAAARTDTDMSTRSKLFNMEPSSPGQEKPHIGLQFGYAEPGDDYDAAVQYGIEVGYQPYMPLAAALELTSFLTDRDNADNLRRTSLMAKGTYNFGGTTPIIRHSFVGAATGPVYDSEGPNDEWNIGIKVLAGVDFPLSSSGLAKSKTFTLGAAASYLTVFNAQDNFLLNGQLKYWF